MKKPQPVALICAGKLTDGALMRFRGLPERLGPVMSTSLRLASRVVNTLRAGYPAGGYDAFEDCDLILLSVPDAATFGFVRELAAAGSDWTRKDWSRKFAILCSGLMESGVLAPLAALGAQTASICEIAGFDGRLFLAEGERAAITAVRPLLAGRDVKVVSVPGRHKAFYLAAAACTGPLLTSLLTCADECLRLSGLGASEASGILQAQALRTTRAFLNAGRKTFQDPADLAWQIAALRERKPAIGEFFEETVRLAGRMGREGAGSGDSQMKGQAYRADKAARAAVPGSRESGVPARINDGRKS
jgi:predicted short-subunit dehydrogenase-like oxidoreductase (DUF2520 family)